MFDDLIEARAGVLSARMSAAEQIERNVAAAATPRCQAAFVATRFEAARSVARAADHAVARGGDPGVLGGLSVSIKDLYDIEGEVTAAGSTWLAASPPAVADAPAVERLRRAGAALIGRTNMSEFAFSGVGINPHHGTSANAGTLELDPRPRIPGGSTSGGATSVAGGAAWAALGSDTGGSIRIPAALQGLVGFKSTARRVPTEGAVPLSMTLDTACAITRSVRDAVVLHEVLASRTVSVTDRPPSSLRLALPRTLMLDGLDETVSRAFERAVDRLAAAGAQIEEIDLPQLGEIAAINATGGFSPAESWAWHRHKLAVHEAAYDPRVAARIRRGATMSAADYIDLLAARQAWIGRMEAASEGFDALLSPTVPIVAPLCGPLLADDEAFFATNALLLRNPSAVNLLDGCAVSLPCHGDGEMPVGLMIWSTAMRDDAVLAVALAIEASLAATPSGLASR